MVCPMNMGTAHRPFLLEGDKPRMVDPSPRSDHSNSAGPEPGGRARPGHAKSILTQPLLTVLRGPTVHPSGPRGFLRGIFTSCGHLSLTNPNAHFRDKRRKTSAVAQQLAPKNVPRISRFTSHQAQRQPRGGRPFDRYNSTIQGKEKDIPKSGNRSCTLLATWNPDIGTRVGRMFLFARSVSYTTDGCKCPSTAVGSLSAVMVIPPVI